MGVPLQVIIHYLEELAPPQRAQSWDKIGLQVGDRQARINCLLVALDASELVIRQAITAGAELIIAHHPLIFSPLTALVWQDDPLARLLQRLIQANISLYVAHTNLDASPGGSSNLLADLLELESRKPLVPLAQRVYKLVVFVPRDEVQTVRLAIGQAGAGAIGDYSYCAFQTEGTGFFQAAETARPYLGEPGKFSSLDEVRLETLVTEERLERVISALKQTHPYQEVAYDLYPLQPARSEHGLGIVGRLPRPLKLSQLAERLHAALKLSGLRWVGEDDQVVEQVAVCGGGGGDLVTAARQAGAELLISGDFKYHQARQAQMFGLALLDIGHFACEYLAMQRLADNLRTWFRGKQKVNVLTCQEESAPFRYYLQKEEQ